MAGTFALAALGRAGHGGRREAAAGRRPLPAVRGGNRRRVRAARRRPPGHTHPVGGAPVHRPGRHPPHLGGTRRRRTPRRRPNPPPAEYLRAGAGARRRPGRHDRRRLHRVARPTPAPAHKSLLIAADNDTVRELNERARADLVAAGTVDDTSTRGPARRADRRPRRPRRHPRNRPLPDRRHPTRQRHCGRAVVAGRTGSSATVNNGSSTGPAGTGRSTVRLLDGDGQPGATAGHPARRRTCGGTWNSAYATTVHRAQGMTTDTAHVLADAATTREAFYVAMTRGRTQQPGLPRPRPAGAPAPGPPVDQQRRRRRAINPRRGAARDRHQHQRAVLRARGHPGRAGPRRVHRATRERGRNHRRLRPRPRRRGPAHHRARRHPHRSPHSWTTSISTEVVTAIRRAYAAGTDVPTVLPRLAAPLQSTGTLTATRLADAIRTHTTTTTRQHPPGRAWSPGCCPTPPQG